MRLAVIVTEYPKTTETFILRDLMAFLAAGVDLRLYHLAPFRHREILHDFARPTRALARPATGALRRSPAAPFARSAVAARLAGAVVAAQGPEVVLAAKSLGLIPVSLALAGELAGELAAWGADHVHAEFAGHPATAAWIVNAATGLPYSVSCRAHDIFRTQRLLGQKLGSAAFVRTVSDFARDFLVARVPGLDPARLHVIHSSVDLDQFPDPGPPPTNPFHVVFVGALQARKGGDVLLRALADLGGDWRLSILGDGPERARLAATSAGLGLGDRVRFLGAQGFDAVMAIYAAASVVVAPSIVGPGGRTEGIPNVMIEALAMRRPAVSTRVSGIPELVIDGVTGRLTAPGSVAELAAALRAVRDDPAGARTMAEAGRRHVEAQFSLRANAARQLALFARYGAAPRAAAE